MRDVLVLCYHAVSPTWTAPLSVTPEAFRGQLERLAERGYVGTTFTRAVLDPPAGRVVAVTFDDGMRSVGDLAAPILRALGWPATLYVPTELIDRPEPLQWPGVDHFADGPDRDELLPLRWEEVRGLQAHGWEIGSHTCTHPRLPDLDDDALAAELRRSKETCEERLGSPCPSIAYPYGAVDDRVVAAAAAAGYRTGAGLPERPGHPERLRWPRVYVDHTDSVARVARRTRPAWRALEASPAWPALQRVAVRVRGRS